MSDSIKVSIELADKAAQRALSDFISKSDSADKNIKKLGESGKDTFNEISVGIGKSLGVYDIFAGNLAANLVTSSFQIMKNAAGELFNTFIVDGVKAAQESQDALNSLNVALAQSGIYSDKTSQDFQDFAKQIQATTTFEDDFVIKNMALIQSLAQLDKDGLQRATKAAVELSSALGKDLSTTSEAIAKAANGNYTAIQKMGIQFDKTGSQAQTFQNALKAIETQFGGSAESKINTFSGAIAKTKNNFGDLQEEFGNLIIQNPAVIAAINAVSNILSDLAGSGFLKGVDAAQSLGKALLTVIDITSYTTQFLNGLATAALTSFDIIIGASTRALSQLVAPFTYFSDTAQDIFENLVAQSNESLNKIGERLDKGGPLGNIITTLDQISKSAQEGFEKIGTGADVAAPKLDNVTSSVQKLSEEQMKQLEDNNKYVDSLAKKNQSIEENQKLELENLQLFYEQKDLLEADADIVNYEQKLARENEFFIARQAILDQNFATEQQRILSSTQSEQTKTQALLQIQKKYESDSLKNKTEYFKKESEFEKLRDKENVENRKSTFATIATLSSSNNNLLATIGKAAAITQIAIDTPVAIGKALAAFPPPFNFAAAGLVGAAMAVQASKIAGLNFEQGGIVPGSSFTGDNVRANVNSGEMILNRTQQAELFKVANGEGSNSSLLQELRDLKSQFNQLLQQPISVQVDGKEIFNITRNQLASGRSY